MEDVFPLIERLETQVERLIAGKAQLEAEAERLKAENRDLETRIHELEEELAVFRDKQTQTEKEETNNKIVKAIEQREDTEKLRKRINELLQKVNKAMALLVVIQERNKDYE